MEKDPPISEDHLHWYKDAIIYELHIKAFRDGNGDGIGDFIGLLEKLDYLQDLGVTAIWILPFYPSPLKDDGYDIADYYSINPSYGTIRQFRQFLREAHDRNLKVITELVVNHTSDQHPWFQRARRAPKGSPERNFYVWTDDPNQYRDVRIIFRDFETSNWTWDETAQQYYWHRFFHHQPDLNFDNPLVKEEVFNILDFWCKLGVDGFRLDAVPYLFERDGTNCENLPETHTFLKELRKHVDEKFPGTMLLAEANMWPEEAAAYFGNGDECHMNYHFPLMPRMFMALRMEDHYPITDIFEQTPVIPENCQWAIFLRNHDELTLEMVTDEERDYMYKVYAKDPKAKINLGIRHRLAPLMDNNRRKIELMNHLLLSLPGTPFIYYGDEIGMGDNFYLGDRDGVRTPMQWSPDRNAGFSEANPQKLYLPVILDPEYFYESVNVETQDHNPSSLLWHMKQMISMRKRYKAFGRGDLKFIVTGNPKVLAFTRSYGDETILVVVNLSRFSQAAQLELGDYKGYLPVEVFSKNRFPTIREKSTYPFTLGLYAYHWFALKKVDPERNEQVTLPELRIDAWKDFTEEDNLEKFSENILLEYLPRTKWFDGRKDIVESLSVVSFATVVTPQANIYLLLIEVTYANGFPEMYQLPVVPVKESFGNKLMDHDPQAILCRIRMNDSEGYLCDALFTMEFQQALIHHFTSKRIMHVRHGEIHFDGSNMLRKNLRKQPELKSRVLFSDRKDTSIAYENNYYLRLYRKLEYGVNPDAEITQCLAEQLEFKHIPGYLGKIEWELDKGYVVMGMMQTLIENHGNGWKYLLERLNEINEHILSGEKEHLITGDFKESLFDRIRYDQLSEEIRELLGGATAEFMRLLGICTGEMHLALAAIDSPDFKPEDFSLHYQRSLFSGMQALVREAFTNQSGNLQQLPEMEREEAAKIIARKSEVLNVLKKIYSHKMDVTRIRTHGNYDLSQILWTGKDVMVRAFDGEEESTFSEQRIKRSPIRDVAEMIRTFYYATHASLLRSNQIRKEDYAKLLPYAGIWNYYLSGIFLDAYLQKTEGASFIPKQPDDLYILLRVYLLEKAVYSFNYELSNRPEWIKVPIELIQSILA